MFYILYLIFAVVLFLLLHLIAPLTVVYNFWFYSPYFVLLLSGVFAYFLTFESEENLLLKTLVLILVGWLPFLYMIFTTPLFQADNYYKLIWDVKQGNFEDIKESTLNNIRIIDQEQAKQIWNKIIWEQGDSIWSQVVVWTYSIQKFKDKLYWVAPLEHSWFFKYNANKDWTPWYIMVNANDSRDVHFVTKHKIKYQDWAYFSNDLNRHIFSYVKNKWVNDITFEIDDEWIPYWVWTLYENSIWFTAQKAIWTVVVNAENWETKLYSLKETPEWIDRIQPESVILSQLSDWWIYSHWFVNVSWKDIKRLVNPMNLSLIHTDDWNSYWYASFTSAWNDNWIIWFTLTNTRTKEPTYYKVWGATDEAAKQSAEGIVQEKKYVWSNPILYNIKGYPTYVIPLKDWAWLNKEIALVSVRNYEIVWLGDTLEKSITNYLMKLNNWKDNNIDKTSKIDKKQIQVSRVSQITLNWNIIFVIKSWKEIYILPFDNDYRYPLIWVDDVLTIEYQKRTDWTLNIEKVLSIEGF